MIQNLEYFQNYNAIYDISYNKFLIDADNTNIKYILQNIEKMSLPI